MRILLLSMTCLLFLAGCGDQLQKEDASSPNRQIRVKQSIASKEKNKDAQQRAEHLARMAASVEQVNGANCVIFGNVAIVGIDVDGKLERARVGTIKYSVAEALRKDPEGANAIVTADIDINARLKEIAADIRRGKPVTAFANELSDMIGRMMPQLPRDTDQGQNRQNPLKHQEDREKVKNHSL